MDNKITLNIGGMSCAACSARVEKVLNNLDGVKIAAVNLASEKAAVTYDSRIIRPPKIKEAIESAGYKVLENSKSDEDRARKQREIKILWTKFIVSAAFSLPLLYIAMVPMLSVYGIHLPYPPLLEPMENPLMYALLELFLVIPVIAAGYKFYTVGFKALYNRAPNMDSLIAIGTTAAVLYSLYNTILIAVNHNAMAVESLYYETAGVIITLILLGKSLEAVSKGRTGEAIKKLMGLSPKTAIIIVNGAEKEIPVDEVEIGDIIVIKPGAKIPVDGTITEGHTAIDESMLTGESIPVDKKAGEPVYAASVNTTGTVRFKAEKIGSDTALSQIIKLVEDAQGSKAPIARAADIVSGYFVPIVCAIAVIAGIIWYLTAAFNPDIVRSAASPLEFSLTIFISILVIACPCALGLATPTAVMVATGKSAEKGILIKSGEALETAHKLDTVIFDKTGTITEGKPTVTDIITIKNDIKENYLLEIVASAEKSSEHPLGQAIVRHAEEKGISLSESDNFMSITGHGIKAEINGNAVIVGSRKLMDEQGISLSELKNEGDKLAADGKTRMYAAVDGKLFGVIAVADVVKQSARSAVESLRKMGIDTVMLTGDNKITAAAIARQVGIDRVLAEVLPRDKADEIKRLRDEGKKVAMVGDGINDAPALAMADVGVAIGSGTDVAMESADIVLMRSDLSGVVNAVNLSKRTIRNIKQNLFWAFGYNVIGIPVAAGLLYAFGGPLLNPIFAAAAMSLSSISVLANALRLKRTLIK